MLIFSSLSVPAQTLSTPTLLKLRFEQRLNAQLPLGLNLRNEAGASVRLGDCLRERPAILILGYYECPMLCGLVLNGVIESLQDLRTTPGKDFDVLFVSIDPQETPALAAAKKRACLRRYGRPGTESGWHFLVGGTSETRALADTVGFQYAYDTALRQYAHPSGIVVVTPEGKVSKYFFGVSYPTAELNDALKSAAAHRVGSPVQQLLLLCFQHMPLLGKNSATIMSVVRTLAVVTILGISGYVGWAVVRDKRHRQSVAGERISR